MFAGLISLCLDLLHKARNHNLVQFGENVHERLNFICNCCGCCCEAMIAARKFAVMNPVHTTNYLPVVSVSECSGCGKCVGVCPVEAMTLVSANDPEKPDKKTARLDAARCLGCGLCVNVCQPKAVRLEERKHRVITPMDSAHKTVLMAIERGRLQNLIFDNHVLLSHRALKQVRSRYLEALISRIYR